MTKKALLTQKQYADRLGVSRQAVNKLIHSGRIPSIHGKIDCEAADAALAPSDVANGGNSISEALRRKEWALAGLREHELQLRTGEVALIADIERMQQQVNSNIRAKLLSIPSKLTPRLVGVSSPAKIKTLLEREIFESLEELSRTAVPD